MPRHSQDREDLLAEATALLPRIQLRLEHGKVFAGFRQDALSLYFDTDPVYHFNAAGELRRAFIDGQLLKAEQGRVVAWQPLRQAESTDMLRHDLSDAEIASLAQDITARLHFLRLALESGNAAIVGQIPADGDAVARLTTWLAHFGELRVAISPRVNG